MNRSYDQIFLINFDAFFDEIKRECMDCIRNVTKKSIVKLTDESVNEYLLEQVMSKSLVKYNVDDIVSGKYDEEIIRIYEECFNEIERELVSFIRSFLFRNVDFGDMLDVSEEKVVSHFINKDNIEKSFIKMRSGKLGKDIIECIKKQKT